MIEGAAALRPDEIVKLKVDLARPWWLVLVAGTCDVVTRVRGAR